MSFLDPLSVFGVTGIAAAAVFSAGIAAYRGLNRSASQSEGLRVVFEGSKPEVDIVCVHGLGGDPVETWTSRRNGKPVNWTTEFLPNCIETREGHRRQIRVLTYGYSPKLFAVSQGSFSAKSTDSMVFNYLPQALYLHSNRLIEQLADLRSGDAEKRRPIIFIAHSLGGLIVKSALVHTSVAVDERDTRLKAIELLTLGVLFFGTPHREVQWKRWSDLLVKMFHVAGLASLDKAIQPLADQAQLLNLQIERYKSIEANFFNFSFYEKSKSQGGLKDTRESRIVDADVAEPLPAKDSTWEKIALKRTHKDLAKFDSDQDPGFLEVNSRINQCLEDKNYDSALDRCSSFFKYRDSPAESPVSSIADLLEAQQDAKDESAKAKQNLARKEPSNSKKAIETKQKALKDSLNKSEQYNGLSDSATLAVVQKIAGYAFEVREYEKAEALYKRLFVSTQTEAPCSEKAATVLKDMAAVAVHQGRLVEATKNLRRVRDIQRILGLQEDDLEVLKVTRQIASLYESRDLYGDALQEYNEIINNFPGTVSDKTQGGGDTNAGLLLQRVKRGKHALVMARSKTVDELFSKLAETE